MSLGPGGKLLLVLAGLAIIVFSLHRAGYLPQLDPLASRLHHRQGRTAPPLSLGDFPPGAVAPQAGLNAMPGRPLKLAIPPRAAAASLLWLAGGSGRHPDAPASKAYALDLELDTYADAAAVSKALALGPEQGGVDAALVSVDDLGMRAAAYHDASPRAVALVARSQGSVGLAGVGVDALSGLRGKRLALPGSGPSRYFALFTLARAHLGVRDLSLHVETDSTQAAVALREGRADAAVGLTSEVALAAKDRAGAVLATSSDAPLLLDFVLVVRGDLQARYPEAVRRLVRGVLDANEAVRKNALDAARLLDSAAPALGDPVQAIKDEPPATLAENLAFFGISGDAPVHFDELYASAASLAVHLGEAQPGADPGEVREPSALRAVASAPAH